MPENEEEGKVSQEMCEKWKRCQVDAGLKTIGGLALGTLGSLMLFRLSLWPIMFGAGFGLGLAYNNCQNDINKSLTQLEDDINGKMEEQAKKSEEKKDDKKNDKKEDPKAKPKK